RRVLVGDGREPGRVAAGERVGLARGERDRLADVRAGVAQRPCRARRVAVPRPRCRRGVGVPGGVCRADVDAVSAVAQPTPRVPPSIRLSKVEPASFALNVKLGAAALDGSAGFPRIVASGAVRSTLTLRMSLEEWPALSVATAASA